tara:strand:+ start:930 stop:3614 length:2685 start_codon:yes stop_codon:yes gene_type:complete
MKKYTLILLLISCSVFSQELFEPVKEISYGNNNHTNRDFLNLTLKDNTDNIYLLGATENDFTFSDVKIIKLDKNLNLLWEKEKSFDLAISYDGIMGAHIDSNNELIIVCRAAYTSYKQTFIVIKYDVNGNLLWEYPVSGQSPFLSDLVNHSFSSYSSFLDDSNNIHLKYQPANNSNEFFFLTISPTGKMVTEFSNSEVFTPTNKMFGRRFKLINNQGVYNMLTVEDIDNDPYQKFMLHKFTASTSESFDLGLDSEATGYFNTPFSESWSIMRKDNNNNLVLITPSRSRYKDYGVLNVNPNGTVKYMIYPNKDLVNDKYPLEFGFDNENNLVIISNNRKSNTSDTLKLTIQKYNQNGDLIYETSKNYAGTFAVIENSNFYVLTDSNKLINVDFDFNIIDEVQLNNIDTYNFSVNDIIKIDGNYFLSGQTEDINYSGSVIISEIDMLIKKTNNVNELNSFRFSGNGTSKLNFRELVVKETDFLMSISEKTGPDNFTLGGSVSPEQKRFVSLKKDDLSILDNEIVPLNETLPTPYFPKNLTTEYSENNGDNYKYIISSDTTKVSLFKNNILQWDRNLNLYKDPLGDGITNDDEFIFDWKVNNKGDFLLTTNVYGLQRCKLYKYSLDNEFKELEFDEQVVVLQPLTNNWIFTMNKSGNIAVYSDRLTLINKGPGYNQMEEFGFYIKEKNNQILLHKHYETGMRRFDQFGEITDDYYKIALGVIPESKYDNNFLIIPSEVGTSISLSSEYAWSRIILKMYDLDVTDTFAPISYADDDLDGIANNIDECRNTPLSEGTNAYGCSSSQVLHTLSYEVKNSQINTYPNPTTTIINFSKLINTEISLIEVYDYVGRQVLTFEDKTLIDTQKIDLRNQRDGIYFIKFYFKNNEKIYKRVVKISK